MAQRTQLKPGEKRTRTVKTQVGAVTVHTPVVTGKPVSTGVLLQSLKVAVGEAKALDAKSMGLRTRCIAIALFVLKTKAVDADGAIEFIKGEAALMGYEKGTLMTKLSEAKAVLKYGRTPEGRLYRTAAAAFAGADEAALMGEAEALAKTVTDAITQAAQALSREQTGKGAPKGKGKGGKAEAGEVVTVDLLTTGKEPVLLQAEVMARVKALRTLAEGGNTEAQAVLAAVVAAIQAPYAAKAEPKRMSRPARAKGPAKSAKAKAERKAA